MVARDYIRAWEKQFPWQDLGQVEQDLLLSRCLIHLFNDPSLAEHLAFRGGTALHKLYLNPAPRYSEDIDLVQVKPGPIGPIMKRMREVIDFFEEPRRTKVGGHGGKALYRFDSEFDGLRMRVKIEINGREHFNVLPWVEFPFAMNNGWFSGATQLRTYALDELLGTKLRALYQRSKGRDLFDLYYAHQHQEVDLDAVVHCFREYITFSTGKRPPSAAEFLLNLEEKEQDVQFMGDIRAILRPEVEYDAGEAMGWVRGLVERLDG